MTRPTLIQLEEAVGGPISEWAHQCHSVSLAIVKSGIIQGRVARGWADGVGGQHSWIVLGPLETHRYGMGMVSSVYDPNPQILDPTLWSYRDDVNGVVWCERHEYNHTPHGSGSIFAYGRPESCGPYDAHRLPEPEGGWSTEATRFLNRLGPLDLYGWRTLAHCPVEDWPANEILTQMDQDPAVSVFIPIDVLGNATLSNPSGLYLR